jgi:hypothetical protein
MLIQPPFNTCYVNDFRFFDDHYTDNLVHIYYSTICRLSPKRLMRFTMTSPPPSRAPRMGVRMPPMWTAETKALTKPEPAQWSIDNTPEPPTRVDRDQHGRLSTGNGGGGRRKGSRNKLSEMFLEKIALDFMEHGAEAIERVRKEDPAAYLKLLAWLIPRELILQRERSPDIDPADLTDEEITALIEAERRRQFICSAITRPNNR